jgi:hypothetical protein
MLEAFMCRNCMREISIIPGDGPDLNKIQDSIKGFQLDGYVTILPLIAIRLILCRMLDLRF